MLKVMKKYIIPNTEAIEAICGAPLCHSNDGTEQQNYPTPGEQGGPKGAPTRVSVLYI